MRKGIAVAATCGALLAVSALFVLLIFYIFAAPANDRTNADPEQKDVMLKTALEWGRLADIPKTASELDVRTEGNMFTRSFRVSFYLAEPDLERWVEDSPGLREAEREESGDGDEIYTIELGGGANTAEAVINRRTGLIEIYVSWS